ncbi:hypothetical protein [Clostridium sp. AWRP]|uniref:hypothetical protein n=1 Tax=Clostridium sp. AWRP TaxID=2212991 RepID=UPI000FD7EB1D|nr:hypothetical protein [Clostridium sp. AWRP]AZV56083.1 hypothetical protein DMR38_05425 [Clostridium sp. AWRP]
MDYSRKNITGTDPVDIKNINDNFKYLFMKIFQKVAAVTTSSVSKESPEQAQTTQPFHIEEPDEPPAPTYAYFADDPDINLPTL